MNHTKTENREKAKASKFGRWLGGGARRMTAHDFRRALAPRVPIFQLKVPEPAMPLALALAFCAAPLMAAEAGGDGVSASVTVGASVASAIVAGVVAWFKGRHGVRRIEPQPFEIKQVCDLVTREECARRIEKIDERDGEIYKLIRELAANVSEWKEGVASQLGTIRATTDMTKTLLTEKLKK